GVGEALAERPGFGDIGIVVPHVPQLDGALVAEERHGDLEVAVIPVSEIALDDGAGEGSTVFDDPLPALPRISRRRIVTPPMPEIAAFEDDRLEILVRPASEIPPQLPLEEPRAAPLPRCLFPAAPSDACPTPSPNAVSLSALVDVILLTPTLRIVGLRRNATLSPFLIQLRCVSATP